MLITNQLIVGKKEEYDFSSIGTFMKSWSDMNYNSLGDRKFPELTNRLGPGFGRIEFVLDGVARLTEIQCNIVKRELLIHNSDLVHNFLHLNFSFPEQTIHSVKENGYPDIMHSYLRDCGYKHAEGYFLDLLLETYPTAIDVIQAFNFDKATSARLKKAYKEYDLNNKLRARTLSMINTRLKKLDRHQLSAVQDVIIGVVESQCRIIKRKVRSSYPQTRSSKGERRILTVKEPGKSAKRSISRQ